MGQCIRCKTDFPDRELRPPPAALRILTWPVFLLFLRSSQARNEVTASYCPRCRRSMSFALFFVAFMIVVILFMYLLKWLGLTEGRLPGQP
jgi:hypothetical protein